ncbi:Soluble aldose sugar dehydrogenase YliI [Variovorax paradoxus]|uniref:Soluble aldose sugar dehydrogenase YliI n=2 Tax=Variovorax paradoxus TaxID=34073 RepID=A0A679J9D3_VARPD|nr:Soluble aldose sugar dehydrogenase YliI [Variovorax paradoxus]
MNRAKWPVIALSMFLGAAGTGFFSIASAQGTPETIATGLENPWGIAFVPGGRFIVTERPGRMRLVAADGTVGAPIAGLPSIAAGGQGGLLDVLGDSAFEKNRTLYFCFSEADAAGSANSTALARATLSADGTKLEALKVIFSQKPKVASRNHFGCRIVEARDGTLFLTLGERFSRKEDAQKLDNHLGKVIRIAKDGSVPADNPFVGKAGALPEIWSYGHRNGQGATLGPDGRFWMNEHGPQGGDEINIPLAGRNYGWPVITYGENYGGGKIGDGITAKDGMEQPLHYWVPSIAPSGMAFLTSDRYGAAWKGNLFIGSLKFGYLDRIELKGGKVVAEHKLLADGRARIRDVKQGPDGLLYVLTDEADGKLLRLKPN